MRQFLFFLLISISFAALPQAGAAQSFRFSQVRIEGNQRIEPGTILSYAGIGQGQAVSAGELNAAYQRIAGSGLFEAVEIDPQGSTLVIRVREWPTINQISIEGNRRLKDEDLMSAIQSRPARVYSPSTAESDAATIVTAYEQAGRLAASVTPKIIRRSNNRVDLVFEVAEGRVTEIERLSFVGNRAFSDRRLRRVLDTKQAGIFRALIRRDTFVADRIEFDKQLLRDFYLSRGYIDFRVQASTSEFSRDRNAFFVTFNVQEGQRYGFGRITVASDLPEIDADAYLREVRIRPGQVYSPTILEANIARLERLAIQQGLDFIRVDPRISRNDRSLTLDIEFQVVRGPAIFIERIDIEGNTTTLDRVVRSQFKVVEGDPFNPREIRAAAERIRALDFFETVDVVAEDGTAPGQVIVNVDVEEKPTGSLGFGASYSASGGLGFNISFAERNFLGRGQLLTFGITTGTGTQSAYLTFAEPAFLGRDVTFRFDGSYTQTSGATATYYDSKVFAFRPTLEFPISENARIGVRYTLGFSRISKVSGSSSAILAAEAALGNQYKSAIGYTFSFDNRAGGLNPDAGVLLRFNQDFYVLGGSQKYIETTALFVAERKMLTREVTFRAIVEGGALYSLSGGTTKITERFFLSTDQLRGFDVRGVGPRDLAVGNVDGLGGNFYAVARFEVDFPLPVPDEYGISGGAFFDIGTLWGLDRTGGGSAGASPVDATAHLRSSVGVSVFWDTPIGPLRFNFSKPLIKQPYDVERTFDLTVSTKF